MLGWFLPGGCPVGVGLMQQVVDDAGGDLLGEHARDQDENLLPCRIGPMSIEHVAEEFVHTHAVLVLDAMYLHPAVLQRTHLGGSVASLARYARVSPEALGRWQQQRDPATRRR